MSKHHAKSLDDLDEIIVSDDMARDPQERARRNQLAFSLLGILMLVVGLGTVIFGIIEIRKFTNNGHWPSVRGTAASVGIETVHHKNSSDSYCIYGNFHYTINNRTYSHEWGMNDCSYSYETVQSRANSYLGATTTVWYDPTNPDRAANQAIGMEWMIIIWGAGALIILFAMVLLGMAMKKPKTIRKMRQPARPL